MKNETMELTWDASSGAAPRKGEIITNAYREKYEVTRRRGNQITLQRIN
jgi:hypothetical protein